MVHLSLDYHRVSDEPAPLFMGGLVQDYGLVPGRVIINLCGAPFREPPSGTVIFTLSLLDTLDEELAPSRQLLERFLASVHPHVAHDTSFWHCHAGLNRSGLAIAAYLHLYRGLTIERAIDQLRARRDAYVLSNPLFEQRLLQWYGVG